MEAEGAGGRRLGPVRPWGSFGWLVLLPGCCGVWVLLFLVSLIERRAEKRNREGFSWAYRSRCPGSLESWRRRRLPRGQGG
jgi:hypothetical protein